MKRLPKFTYADYRELLQAIRNGGFFFAQVAKLETGLPNAVYLRHDVDFSVDHTIEMAKIEYHLGISSTYYLLLTGPYNIFREKSSRAIRILVDLGHDIGLHYDLSAYPKTLEAAKARLTMELDILEFVAGTRINTIVMHEPFRGNEDLFLEHRELINPSFFRVNDDKLLYISDSCRAWRDDNLIRFLERQTDERRLHLNIHPELWLAKTPMDRLDYLEKVLIPAVFNTKRHYFSETVRNVWLTHPAVTKNRHDEYYNCDKAMTLR